MLKEMQSYSEKRQVLKMEKNRMRYSDDGTIGRFSIAIFRDGMFHRVKIS